jgi:hypothetical protein
MPIIWNKMNRSILAMCVSMAAVLITAAGCGESRAPAMTTSSQTATSAPDATADSTQVVGDAAANGAIRNNGDEGAQRQANDRQLTPSAVAQPERTRDISFDDLKFDINKGDPFRRSMLTEKIEALEGKPIRIRGFILPSYQQAGLTQFVLVRDNFTCCFGPGAALYDCVIVEMKPGKSTDYSLYPVAVEGTFSIREIADGDGKTVAIYHLDGETVR